MNEKIMQALNEVEVFTLSHNVKIYVPSTVDVNITANKEMVNNAIKTVAKKMSQWFGGTTVYNDCTGYWVSDKQGLVAETITIVSANCDENALSENIYNVISLVKQLGCDMKQECISLEIDGVLNIVTTNK